MQSVSVINSKLRIRAARAIETVWVFIIQQISRTVLWSCVWKNDLSRQNRLSRDFTTNIFIQFYTLLKKFTNKPITSNKRDHLQDNLLSQMNKHERVFTRPLGKVLQVSVSCEPRGIGKMSVKAWITHSRHFPVRGLIWLYFFPMRKLVGHAKVK